MDISTNKTSSHSLTHKIEATRSINEIQDLVSSIKVTLRWLPGHKGHKVKSRADQLATTTEKKKLSNNHDDKPTCTSFRAAVKAWAEKANLEMYTQQDIKRLGNQPHPGQHLQSLKALKKEPSTSTITQLRTGHIPLFQYLFSRNLRTDPTCTCGTGP